MAVDLKTTHLFDLPGEIRNTIYKFIFGDLAIHTCSPDYIRDARRFTNTRWTTSLFSVNHQVRREALSAFSENLTVYCRWEDLRIIKNDFAPFVLSKVSRAVAVYNDTSHNLLATMKRFIKYQAVLPKLENLVLLYEHPLRSYAETMEIHLIEDLVRFLRGGMDKDFLYQIDEAVWSIQHAQRHKEDHVSMRWATNPANRMKHLCLEFLYVSRGMIYGLASYQLTSCV